MWKHKSTGFQRDGLSVFHESPSRWLLETRWRENTTLSYIRLDEVNEVHKQGMIPFNALLNVVKKSKDLIYAASAFYEIQPIPASTLNLWHYQSFGGVRGKRSCCEFKEVLCLTSFHNCWGPPSSKSWIIIRPMLQSLGITSWFQILAKISERTIWV